MANKAFEEGAFREPASNEKGKLNFERIFNKPKTCPNAETYTGKFPPRCNNGYGCEACYAKWQEMRLLEG